METKTLCGKGTCPQSACRELDRQISILNARFREIKPLWEPRLTTDDKYVYMTQQFHVDGDCRFDDEP